MAELLNPLFLLAEVESEPTTLKIRKQQPR